MSKTVLIIIIAVAVLFMGMMGAGFFILWNKMANVTQPQAVVEEEAEPEEASLGPIYPIKTMIVNLADEGGKRYLRVSMEFELENEEMIASMDKLLPRIRDSILMILPTKKYDDINTTEGKIKLRNEMMEKVNSLLVTGKIQNIYFTEFVVQ